ncbi:MAG TPA: hypothetical protein DCE44_09695, partial [Verrucomicrobiales bacterium]|nr:hypothetical protein [Verrucomicrobiales bacterium]
MLRIIQARCGRSLAGETQEHLSVASSGAHLKWFVITLLLAFASVPGWSQSTPAWWSMPKPLPPPGPSEKVLRAASAQEILTAAEVLAPGTTLLIEPGIYSLPRPLVLRRRQDITIRSVSGDPSSVTLKGKGWELGDDHDDILHIADCRGVRIAGLTFADCRSYGIKVEAEHGPKDVQIDRCRFRDIGVRAIKGSAGRDPGVRAHRGSVRFCDFENSRIPPANWLFEGDYIAGIDMMALE